MTTPDAFAAVPGAIVDDGVLLHVGGLLAEQRALAHGAAVAPRGDRAVLAVAGADRLRWLDALCTQRLADVAPGVGVETLVVDARGHVQHAAAVIDDGVTTWLITDRSHADALLGWLSSQRGRERVHPRDARDELAVVGGTAVAAQAVGPALREGVSLVWRDPWPGVVAGGWTSHDGAHPGADRDWAEALVEPVRWRALAWQAQTGAVRLAGAMAVDALRIAAWRPRVDDVDARTLPQEMDWLRTAVHVHKGRYRGQDAVAAVQDHGRLPRRLVALQLDGSESILPARGDVVRVGDAPVGRVRAAAVHHEDGPVALALVRRTTPLGVDLVVDTEQGPVAAGQEVIVPPAVGRP